MSHLFEESLLKTKENVWPVIESYLKLPDVPEEFSVKPEYQDISDFHWEMVKEYPKRMGKYLRPALVRLTALAMGAKEEKALLTAAAMQVSEEWILGHDDWEDNSLLRRGKPCLHRIYGDSLAVNAGDALHMIMWKIILDNRLKLGDDMASKVAEEFYRMLTRTALGQTAEIYWTLNRNKDLSDDDILFILEGKTGYYTIAGPMRLGALTAGANEEQLDKISRFGRYLGVCFQIVDDILDLTCDFRGLKENCNDIYEGKRTVIMSHLTRSLQAEEKKKLNEIMDKSRDLKTAEEVMWVREKMNEAGSVEYAKQMAADFAEKARTEFENSLGFLDKQPARDELKAGIEFILNRDY